MALVSKNIPNLINGVSQQPPSLRLGTQGEAQENGLSDVVDGLKKRPPTEFLKKLVKCKSSWAESHGGVTSDLPANWWTSTTYVPTHNPPIHLGGFERKNNAPEEGYMGYNFNITTQAWDFLPTPDAIYRSESKRASDISNSFVHDKTGLGYFWTNPLTGKKYESNYIVEGFTNNFYQYIKVVFEVNGSYQRVAVVMTTIGEFDNSAAATGSPYTSGGITYTSTGNSGPNTTPTRITVTELLTHLYGSTIPLIASTLYQGNLSSSNTEVLTSSELDAAFIHTYKRSDDEQYTVVILPDATTPIVLAYDILGNLRYQSDKSSWLADGTTIAYTLFNEDTEVDDTYYGNSDDTSYLIGLNATAFSKKNITATSVTDSTFIVNRKKVVEKSSIILPEDTHNEALVYLKSVNYGRAYNIKMTSKSKGTVIESTDGSNNDVNTPNNNSNNDRANNLKVSTLVAALRDNLKSKMNIQSSVVASTRTPAKRHSSPSTKENELYNRGSLSIPFGADNTDTTRMIAGTLNATTNKNQLHITAGGTTVPATGFNLTANGVSIAHQYAWSTQRLPRTNTTANRRGNSNYGKYPNREIVVTLLSANQTNNDVQFYPASYNSEPYFICSTEKSTDALAASFGDFDVLATDDDGGANLSVFKDTAKTFTSLPAQCVNGFRIAVVGDNQKKEDNFHVQFTGEGGSGYWKETMKAGLVHSFDLATMPHTLRQGSDLQFSFSVGDWDSRVAGDDNTNPFPSFVGQTINDVFFHRNRLGVVSGENVVFSEASGYFNFFRTTVRTLLDSAPIDVAVSQNEVSDLKAAIPIQDNLLLFSELNQFTLSAAQLLTPTEVAINQSTNFECDLEASPVGAGSSVFFATKAGGFAGVREYYTNNETEIKDAALITSHVPQYLQGNIRKMAASTNEDMLLCLTSKVKSEVYVYNFYDQGNERLQSAWSKWKFAKDIVDVSFNNADLYFTFSDGSFEKMDLGGSSEEITYSEANSKAVVLTLETKTVEYGGVDYNVKGYAIGDGTQTVSFGAAANTLIKDVYLYQLVSDTSQRGLYIRLAWPYLAGSDVAPSTAQLPTSITVGGVTIPLTGSWYLGASNNHIASIAVPITDQNFTDWFGAAVDTTVVFNIPETAVDTTSRTYKTLLDHQVKVTQLQGDSTFDVADLDAQFTADSESQFVDHRGAIIARGDSATEKAKIVTYINNKQHKENGTLVNNYVYAGRAYTFKYQLSEQVFKPVAGDVTQLSRFQLRRLGINYSNTGTFDVTVKSTGREANVTKFTGRILGQADNILGYSPVVEDGSINIGIQSQAKETDITITNSSHLPCVFQSAEWEGFVVLRNQRL